jgi:hypothetical protein
MSEEAARFRYQARQCRDLAIHAREEEDRLQLIQLARDMVDEADKIEAEQRESARPSG